MIFEIENHRIPSHYDLHIKNFNSDELKFLIEYQYDSFGNQNHSVAAVKPSASNCPLDGCIGLFESPFYPIKSRNPLMRIPVSLVGVSGFEPEVSWTRIKSHLFNIVLLRSKSVDFIGFLWYHCVVRFYTVVYLLISLFTQVFTFGRQ